MAISVGYWVDLADVKLDESTTETWIHAMPLGDYEHPLHGVISITPDRVKHFADNVNTKVRGQDLNIDYDHKEGEAAGWVKQAEARSDGLWLNVDWTKDAHQKLQEKKYRYFSPEFNDVWTHPKTKVIHHDVVFGGAITNRPFLKDILPINMSEVLANATASVPKSNEGSKGMKPEQIKSFAQKLGLGEDATEDEVIAGLDELDIVEQTDEEVTVEVTETIAAAEQALEDAKKLAETKPEYASFVKLMETQAEQLKAQGVQLSETTTALKLSEVNNTVKMLSDKASAEGFALPIPLREKINATLLTLPTKQLSEGFVGLVSELLDAKLVALGEKGNLYIVKEDRGGKSAAEVLNDKVIKLTETGKVSYGDAVQQIMNADPQLAADYRSESYANSGGE